MAFMESSEGASPNPAQKIFIAGSISIQQLDPSHQALLDAVVHDKANVLIGDAPGIDRLVQLHLAARHVQNVTVFHVGNEPRNNAGHWLTHGVQTEHPAGTRAYFTAKDMVMAQQADFGLMIWDGKSPGTYRNIQWLAAQDKPVFVFDAPKKEWSYLGLDGEQRGVGVPAELSEVIARVHVLCRTDGTGLRRSAGAPEEPVRETQRVRPVSRKPAGLER
jgi:hypothetical protein